MPHPSFDMSLGDLLSADQIIEDMSCSTMKQAIEELVDRLATLKLVDKKSTAVRRVMERERLAPTALGSGVAIPHARMEVGDQPVFAIGRHRGGIDFGSSDGSPVHLIFLLIWQPERPGLFNQLFANLVSMLGNADFRNELMSAKDAQGLRVHLGRIRIGLRQSVETALDGRMLISLQRLESELKTQGSDEAKIRHNIELIREDLDPSILWRYDRLKKLHGMCVVAADRGICGGCSMQLSSGQASAMLKNPHLLFICERCGRFIVHDLG